MPENKEEKAVKEVKQMPQWTVSTPIKKEKEEKPFWARCGVAFNNPDRGKGVSISVKLDTLSMTGEYVLFPSNRREED